MNQQQVEQLRWASLEYLACRSVCAFSADMVTRGLVANGIAQHLGTAITQPDVLAALAFLAGEGLVSKQHPPMSAIPVYQVTSKGTTSWERKRVEEG